MSTDRLPWPKPKSHYDNDGPRNEDQCKPFEIFGLKFEATFTRDFAMRDRFKTVCLTCEKVLHDATTSPTSRIEEHLRYHGVDDILEYTD